VRCPACGSLASKVVDSRPAPEGTEIKRRRACEACGERFTTYERVEVQLPLVVKRDGRREPWDADKLRWALRTACRKRPVTAEAMEAMVARTTARVIAQGEREVATSEIGEALLDELHAVDEVAYARFASVYRQFERLADFVSLAERE
jgi:transcriptional repressor NrdR